MKERIEEILQRFSLTVTDLAEQLGVQKSSISHLISGRNMPSFAFCQKLIKAFPTLNIEWFITGEGEAVSSQTSEEREIPSLDLFGALSEVDNGNAKQPKKSRVERIIVFYDDNTFKEYTPS